MKHVKRLMSVLLVLCLVLGLTVPALAAGNPPKRYDKYMCVGDSIAAGCGLNRQDGVETQYDYDRLATDKDVYLEELYGTEHIYRGYTFERVPYAYHSFVADATGAELLQNGRSGLRAVELRYMLEGIYNDRDETRYWGNFCWDDDGNGFTLSDVDKVKVAGKYIEHFKETDLLSLNIGSNDVLSMTLNSALGGLTGGGETDPVLDAASSILNQFGSLGAALAAIIDTYQGGVQALDLVTTINDNFTKNIAQFKTNYDACIKAIYKLNPDIEIAAIGLFNSFKDIKLSADNNLDISIIIEGYLNEVNSFLRSYETKYPGQYYFVDVKGTSCYPQVYDDPYFWDLFTLKAHPNLEGHRFMADKIIAALPEGLAAPSVSSSNVAASGKLKLSWDAVSKADKYNVYRASSKDGSYKLIGSTGALYYTDNTAKAGETYYYKVTAQKGSYESLFSNIVYRTCDLAAPIVTGGNDAKTGHTTLKWYAVDGASKYEIWRATSRDGDYVRQYTTTKTSYTNTTSKPGVNYYYKVVAISSKTSYANSAPSDIVNRVGDCARPTISGKVSGGYPTLSWSSVPGADSYVVYRASSANGSYSKMYTTSKTSYTNTTAKSGNTYYYKIVAVSSLSSYSASAYSNVVSLRAR